MEAQVTDGIVTLSGAVADVSQKEAIQDLTRRVPGVVETLNRVEVSPSRAEYQVEIDERIAFPYPAFLIDPRSRRIPSG